ncbi:glycosyltransferase family 4 protein, partial [bacterium]|nr:glycosyltransferase family 4 protein [bacterium]
PILISGLSLGFRLHLFQFMKKIGIDASFLKREITGVGRYLRNILNHLVSIDKENQYFLFCPGKIASDYQKMGYKIINTGESRFCSSKLYFPFWIFFTLPFALRKNKVDIFWQPHHFLPPFGLFKKTKYLITVHDLIPKIDKDYRDFTYRLYLNLLLPQSIKKSVKIITISENSKKDIMRFYNLPKEKIEVIYEAADKRFKPRGKDQINLLTKIRERYHLPEEFILYISKIEKRKNIEGIIRIADILKRKNKIKFILFGKLGFRGRQLLREIKKRDNMSYKGFLDEKDIPYIYNLSKIFLFPSFYEGFGLPVLEAMQSGVPVLASNTSSLKEVVGDGGIMHNPTDYEAFAKDIIRLLKDNRFYEKIRERGISQAKKFSWERSAKKLVKIFNEL